jgi:myosin heavy subunit
MQQKESIDLMNVDYEDVLHLYRGWRKSESQLKDKDKELFSLKEKIRQLQESHAKFRTQINSLESVKEFNVQLQNQLSHLQHENRQLKEENMELANLNVRADELLKEKDTDIMGQAKSLKEVQIEFATLRGRYEESLKVHKDLERTASKEQALRMSADSRLATVDQTIGDLREENRGLRQQLELANVKLRQCDQEMLHASEQLSSISKEVINISTTREALSHAESEVGVLKGDISRLIRLLENSPATKEFLAHWKDSGGMHFAGIDKDPSTNLNRDTTDSLMQTISKVNGETDFWENRNASGYLEKYDLTPLELNQLKEIHGSDPFPMTSNYQEEAEYWVPADAAKLGIQFMQTRFPNTSPRVIMDFLRSMNKVSWYIIFILAYFVSYNNNNNNNNNNKI